MKLVRKDAGKDGKRWGEIYHKMGRDKAAAGVGLD